VALTPKQKAFCEYYAANGGNGTQAAIDAGYSENSAGQIGEQNLKKTEIICYLETHSKKSFNPLIVSLNEKYTAFDVLTDYAFGGDKQAALEYLKTL
jgi:phage terminase small subunit